MMPGHRSGEDQRRARHCRSQQPRPLFPADSHGRQRLRFCYVAEGATRCRLLLLDGLALKRDPAGRELGSGGLLFSGMSVPPARSFDPHSPGARHLARTWLPRLELWRVRRLHGPVIDADGSVVTAGTVTEVSASDGQQLVRDGFAELVSRRIASAHE
jgi:hypothetical protein